MPRITVIDAGRLIDGTGAEPIEAARMVVEGERIREVGPASQVKMPDGDVEDVLRFANAVAALNCRGLGARGGIPWNEEVERLMTAKPGQTM